MPTLKITVGKHDSLDDRTRAGIEAVQAGDDPEDTQPTLNVDSYAALSRLLSPANLELLETIAERRPASIRETADAVDRDYKQVHRNLSELADIGVIEFEGSGAGSAKRPILAYDGLEIDIPFAGPEGTTGTATP